MLASATACASCSYKTDEPLSFLFRFVCLAMVTPPPFVTCIVAVSAIYPPPPSLPHPSHPRPPPSSSPSYLYISHYYLQPFCFFACARLASLALAFGCLRESPCCCAALSSPRPVFSALLWARASPQPSCVCVCGCVCTRPIRSAVAVPPADEAALAIHLSLTLTLARHICAQRKRESEGCW